MEFAVHCVALSHCRCSAGALCADRTLGGRSVGRSPAVSECHLRYGQPCGGIIRVCHVWLQLAPAAIPGGFPRTYGPAGSRHHAARGGADWCHFSASREMDRPVQSPLLPGAGLSPGGGVLLLVCRHGCANRGEDTGLGAGCARWTRVCLPAPRHAGVAHVGTIYTISLALSISPPRRREWSRSKAW